MSEFLLIEIRYLMRARFRLQGSPVLVAADWSSNRGRLSKLSLLAEWLWLQ
jgi:hypothetical protein